MRDSFDGNIHPTCEEDLLYPDEADEFLSVDEVKFHAQQEKELKRLQRKMAKRIR